MTATAQTLAARATADFKFDVPVANPKLWDLKTPNLYRLTTNVQVDGTTIAAAVSDSTGRVVPGSNAPIKFTLTGPGKIIAVDSASQTQETFRGDTRNAFNGLAYAIVQATGVGTITVSATSNGLSAGSATVEGKAGPFVACSGSCH
ncbi:MAG: hypothetical protein ABW061_16115 [Polyangiaceae bacterium]